MRTFIFSIFLCYSFFCQGQTNQSGKNIVYRFERVFYLDAHTQGGGVGYLHGRLKGIYKTTYTDIHLNYYKDLKERRISNIFGSFNAFVYAKQNSFLNLKIGKTVSNIIFQKGENQGVRVDYHLGIGLNVGLLKPYYLEIRRPNTGQSEYLRYESPYESNFLNIYQIEGGTSFFRGIFESAIIPGGYAEAGLDFEFGEFKDIVRVLRVGGRFDLYPRNIDIMVLEDNKPYFVTLFARYALGWRTY